MGNYFVLSDTTEEQWNWNLDPRNRAGPDNNLLEKVDVHVAAQMFSELLQLLQSSMQDDGGLV